MVEDEALGYLSCDAPPLRRFLFKNKVHHTTNITFLRVFRCYKTFAISCIRYLKSHKQWFV